EAVIVCPSNSFISIGPIVAVPGVRDALKETSATKVAVTPIVGAKALKGPTAEMLSELGHEVSARAVAAMYSDFLDAFLLDETDDAIADAIRALGMKVFSANTVMTTLDDKQFVARRVLDICSLPGDG